MAMTETRPAEADDDAARTAASPGSTDTGASVGVLGIFGTADPATIGRLWIGTSLLFVALSGVLGALLGIERLEPTTYDVLDGDTFAQTFSLHTVAGVFLGLLPLLIGIATVVVPRQLGAETIAFPRAAAAAYWTFLLGGSMVFAAYVIDGGPFGGNERGVDLFIASLALTLVAIVLASVCIATTVLALRVPGIRLDRAPAFSWSMLVACTIWILSLGLLVGLLILVYVDSRYEVNSLADRDSLAQWLRWAVVPPQVFAAGIPALGFAAEVVPVFSRVAQRRHSIVLGAIAAYGALGFGAWTFYGFRTTVESETGVLVPRLTEEPLYIAMAIAIVLPALALLGGLADTIRRGRPRLDSPLLFGVAAALMIVAGCLAGAVRAIPAFGLVSTSADASVAHYILVGSLIAAIGAIHYWWPQVLTRPLSEGLGRLTAVCLLLGTIALALPDLVSGFADQLSGGVGIAVEDEVEALNVLSLIGGGLVVVGVLVFVGNLAGALGRRDHGLRTDPWGGHTLEWAEDPAAVDVASHTPLLDAREPALQEVS